MTIGEVPASHDILTGAKQDGAGPLAASGPTRAVYCLALVAFVISSIKPVWSWIGHALGQGFVAMAGPSLFFVLAAAIAYRSYEVLRYPDALQARTPSLAGWLLRGLAWMVMAAGVFGLIVMFLIQSLTSASFASPRDAGLEFFVIGVYASTLASAGWAGCVMFEISRLLGEPVAAAAGRSARQRSQDYTVMAALAVMATAVPLGLTLLHGTPCHGPTLGRCAAKIEGGVWRMVAVPVGAPVALESNLDEIEYRHPSGRSWVLHERPDLSLLKSGHPIARDGRAAAKVTIEAASAGKGATITLTVSENGVTTARFSTRFESRARIEPSRGGARKLVVGLTRNVERPVLTNSDGFLDELYQQMRLAIGSEREVAEAAARVEAAAEMAESDEAPASLQVGHSRPATNCDGVLRLGRGNAERDFVPSAGSYLPEAIFLSRDPPPTVLLHRNDRVSCHGGSVWFAAANAQGRTLRIRKYDEAARLQRHLLVSLPPRPQGEFEFVDEASFADRGDRVEFALIVQDGKRRRLERFNVKL